MIEKYKPARVAIYDNVGRKTAAQVKAETGCDLLFNGGYFGGNYQTYGHIRVNGKTIAKESWEYMGYGWNNGELPKPMSSADMGKVDNFFSCLWVLEGGAKLPVNDTDKELGGFRGRTGWGFTPVGELCVLCTSNAVTAERMTLSAARNKLAETGCVSATLNDGGGSSSGIFPTGTVYGDGRAIRNFICVWLNKGDKPVATKKYKICLDPGHGLKESANQSPDGTYKEYEFTLDMAKRTRTHLLRCGFDVMLTREDDSTPGLSERAAKANAWGADLYVSKHSNAANNGGGWYNAASGLTVWTYAAGGERERAAKLILEEMKAAGVGIWSAGLYNAKFTVLAQTNMPAVLVEYLFHTCQSDVALLKDSAYREKMAIATAKAICRYFGVSWVDGGTTPAEPETPVSSLPTLSRLLKRTTPMMSGADVKAMQSTLNAKGYNSGTADGVFGDKTLVAVKNFQAAQKIAIDGIVGSVTWQKLGGE